MTLVKVNALIDYLTAILESIDLILVGRASHKITFHTTYYTHTVSPMARLKWSAFLRGVFGAL